MLSSQQQIIGRALQWLGSEQSVWLCTILKTWGSSPRPVGAMMACTPEGDLIGSISGGCIEEDFLEQLRNGLLKQRFHDEGSVPFVVKYGVTVEEQARLKLPCGGQLHVLLEFIKPTDLNKGRLPAPRCTGAAHQYQQNRRPRIRGNFNSRREQG